MLISKNIPNYHQPQFKSKFITNDKYKELLLYAKKQKNYPEFQNVVNQIQNSEKFGLKIDFGKKMTLAPCDYGGGLKKGLVPEILSTFFSISKTNNKKRSGEVVEYACKNISPLEYAYKKVLSLGDITTQLYQQLFTEKFNPLKIYSESAKEIAIQKVKDADEKSLIKVIKQWDKNDSDIFQKFKSNFHFYPEQENNKIYEKMSILDYLNAVKKDRFFDFNSELIDDKCTYYGYSDLALALEKDRKKVTTKEIEKFLYDISQDKNLSKKMVEEFSDNKKNPNIIKQTLIELLGNNKAAHEKYNKWYHDEQYGYKKAYSDYYNKLFDSAKDLMTIVKQSPNVAPWAFVNKAKELNTEPILGKLPEKFGNIKEFRTLIDELIKFDKDYNNKYSKKKYKNIKNAEHYITINDKLFKVEKLSGGFSAKTKYKVTTDDSNTYILKFNDFDAIGNTWRSTQIRENQAMRADSPYLDALVDFYLKENGCTNAADVQFFDYTSKAILYKITKGEQPESGGKIFKNLYLFNNSELVKEVKNLGVILNDIKNEIGDSNFIIDKKGNNVLIDTGHAYFSHPFRPMVPGKHISLSNLCGREII